MPSPRPCARQMLLVLATGFLCASITRAQETVPQAVCGMDRASHIRIDQIVENTRQTNPELYGRIADCKAAGHRLMRAEDEMLYTFIVQKSGQFVEVTARLEHEGARALVWVDLADTARSNLKQALPLLKRALDTAVGLTATNIPSRDDAKGILQNDIEVFGDVPPDPEWEHKTHFLLTDLDPGILGYFWPHDQTSDPWSNQMNLLYIDSREGISGGGAMTQLLSTIAHEFQHLIHYVRYPSSGHASHRFINEGLSENANLVNGYYDRQNNGYLTNTNLDFFSLRTGDPSGLMIDYQRAMTFVHYLREQLGEQFVYRFAGTRGNGFERLASALSDFGSPMTAEAVMTGFAVANLLQVDANPSFAYRLRLSAGPGSSQNNPARAAPHYSYTGASYPATNNVPLQAGGVVFAQFTDPPALRARFTGAADTRVAAVGVRNGGTEIIELQHGVDYTLPMWEGGPYDRLTFVLVSVAGGLREVQWNIESLTTGIGNRHEEPAAVDFTGISVDASSLTATAHVRLTGSAPATLEVVNARGDIVARPLERATVSAGSRGITFGLSNLPAGSYVVRLLQDGRTQSRLLIVTR